MKLSRLLCLLAVLVVAVLWVLESNLFRDAFVARIAKETASLACPLSARCSM